MCSIDWGLVADWIAAVAALGTLAVAGFALNVWRTKARASIVHEVEAAAWSLRYAFYGARSIIIEGWEFPELYREAMRNRSRTDEDEAEGHWHVYQNRLKEMWPYVKAVAELRAKCGAVFGDSAADACEKLAMAARALRFHMEQDVQIKRAGESVRQWTDQDHVREVSENVLAQKGSKDKLSTEFETAFRALLNLLKPHR